MSVLEKMLKFSYPSQCKKGDPFRLAPSVHGSSGIWTGICVPTILSCADVDT